MRHAGARAPRLSCDREATNDVAVRIDEINRPVALNRMSAAAGPPPNQSVGRQLFVSEEDHIAGDS